MSERGVSLEVLSAGVRSALGDGCLAVTMLARATSLQATLTRFRTGQGGRVRMGLVADVPPALRGVPRLVALAAPALAEAVRSAEAEVDVGHGPAIPVLLALPDLAPGEVSRHDGALEVLADLAARSGVAIDAARSAAVRAGRLGVIELVERANEMLWSPSRAAPRAVVVGGVDSHNDLGALQRLVRRGGLRADGTAEGAPPSEAAAFVVLARPGERARPATEGEPRRGPRVTISHVATWRPDRSRSHDEAGSRDEAEELVARFADVVFAGARRDGASRAWLLTDVREHPVRAAEWEEAAARAALTGVDRDASAPRLGHVGAATGALLIAMAWASWRAGCAPAPAALLVLRSNDGEAAVVGLAASADEGGARASAEPVPPVLPAKLAAIAARDAIERIDALPAGVARDRWCAALDAAWTAIGEVEAGAAVDHAYLANVERAAARVREAMEMLRGDEAREGEQARAVLAGAGRSLAQARAATIDRLASAAPDAPAAVRARPFVASTAAPALHALPGPAPKPFDALARARAWALPTDEADDPDEEAEPLPPPPQERPADEAASRRRILRASLDAIGRHRPRPSAEPGEPAAPGGRAIDARLLAHLDAVIALARPANEKPSGQASFDLIDEVLAWAAMWPRDPARAFARAFVLGCLDGGDGVRVAAMLLARSSPTTYAAQIEALRIASNPAIRSIMERLCLDPSPRVAGAALDVLSARGEVTFAPAALLLLHPDTRTRASAARALGTVPEREAAKTALEAFAQHDPDPEVASAARLSLHRLSGPGAPARVGHAGR